MPTILPGSGRTFCLFRHFHTMHSVEEAKRKMSSLQLLKLLSFQRYFGKQVKAAHNAINRAYPHVLKKGRVCVPYRFSDVKAPVNMSTH